MYELKSSTSCQQSAYSAQKTIVDDCSDQNGRKGISGFPGRLERYGRGHARAASMADYARDLGDDQARRRAHKLSRCGAHLHFRHYFTIDQIRLHEAYFCQQTKLCPLCAIRRGAKMLRRYVERLLHVIAERPELRAYLVTLTVKDGGDLGERIEHLTRAIDDLYAGRRRWNYAVAHPRAKRQAWTEAARAAGSVGSIEVKRGKGSGLWHPHFHDAWLCEEAPNADQLRREWQAITGDSFIIDVRPFHYVASGEPATAETIARDFSEVFKYALKFAELNLADNWNAAQLLAGRRLIRSYGVLFRVKVPEDLTDDPLDDQDLPYVQFFYRYMRGRGYVLEHYDGDVPGDGDYDPASCVTPPSTAGRSLHKTRDDEAA